MKASRLILLRQGVIVGIYLLGALAVAAVYASVVPFVIGFASQRSIFGGSDFAGTYYVVAHFGGSLPFAAIVMASVGAIVAVRPNWVRERCAFVGFSLGIGFAVLGTAFSSAWLLRTPVPVDVLMMFVIGQSALASLIGIACSLLAWTTCKVFP